MNGFEIVLATVCAPRSTSRQRAAGGVPYGVVRLIDKGSQFCGRGAGREVRAVAVETSCRKFRT